MRKIIFAIAVVLMIGYSFSYIEIPSKANGEFNIAINIPGKANKSDLLILAPANWKYGSYKYTGASLISEKDIVTTIDGKNYSSIHFRFTNVSDLSVSVKVIPNGSGNVKVYYISPNGFLRVTKDVKVTNNPFNFSYIFIIGCLLITPLIAYKAISAKRGRKR